MALLGGMWSTNGSGGGEVGGSLSLQGEFGVCEILQGEFGVWEIFACLANCSVFPLLEKKKIEKFFHLFWNPPAIDHQKLN